MRYNNILLLGLSDTAIMTARCFKKYKSLKIYSLDYEERHNGFYSNMIKPLLTPDPSEGEEIWLMFIINWIKQINKRFIIIPVTDEFAYLTSKFRAKFNEYCSFILPEIDTLETIIERDHQFKAAIDAGLNVPPFSHRNPSYSYIKNNIKIPFAIKPVNVVKWRKSINKKGFIITNWEQLKNILDFVVSKKVDYLAQEIIEGDNNANYEVNSLFLPDGTILQHTIRKIRQYPDKFGTATCIEVSNNDEVKELASILIKNLGLYGFSNIEFKYSQKENKYYYIEANPRVWYQVNFSAKLGINFPVIYFEYLSNGTYQRRNSISGKGKWVDFLPDILFWKSYRKIYNLSLISLIKSWLPIYSTGLLSFKDIKPFIRDLNIKKKIKRILLKT